MSPTSGPCRRLGIAIQLLALLLATTAPGYADEPSPVPTPPTAGTSSSALWPPAVAPVGGRVLRRFERPVTPYGPGHRGVDLAARRGEVVRASLAGTVAFAGAVGGVVWVTVAHGGWLNTTYSGLDPVVAVGDRVTVGSALGRATDGARVDWGARHRGAYIDPLGLLGGWRVQLVPVDGGD